MYSDVFNQSMLEILMWLTKEFPPTDIKQIVSLEDLQLASDEMIRLTGAYSYLSGLLSYAEYETRRAKKDGPKELYEENVGKKKIIDNFTNSVDKEYKAISRAVTVYQLIQKELTMNAGGNIYEK